MTRARRRTRRAWLLGICLGWALSQAVAWGLRPLITGLLHQRDLDAFLNNEAMSFGLYAETSSFLVSGALLGVALWLLLRGVVPRAWLLLPLTVVGWLAVANILVVGEVLGGAVVGGLQWVVLRRAAPRAAWAGGVWLAVSTASWLVGFELIGGPWARSGVDGQAFVHPTPGQGWALSVWALPTARGMTLGGLVYGVLVGTLLAVLLYRRDAPRTAGPTGGRAASASL